MFTSSTDNLDQLLDELEDLARSDVPSGQFWATLLERLRLVLTAQSARVMLFAGDEQYLTLASSGDSPHAIEIEQSLSQQLHSGQGRHRHSLMGDQAGEIWIAVPLRPGDFAHGYLLLTTRSNLPQPAYAGLLELLTAFAEVVHIRQQLELDTFLNSTWDQVQELSLQIGSAASQDNAATLLSGGLARTLGAARVSLLSAQALSVPYVLAVSGVPKINASAGVVKALQAIGLQLQQTAKPFLRQQPVEHSSPGEQGADFSADGCFANLIGLRLASHSTNNIPNSQAGEFARPSLPATWLVIEYASHAEMTRHATRLPYVLPTLAVAWEQQLRWLRVPKLARTFALGPLPSLRARLQLLKWPILIGLLLLAVWAVRRPYPLVIEGEGAFEPATSRAIYAVEDGFVEELLVEDGQVVHSGDPLVQLRSPTLELRIEQVAGELRGVAEESSGIRIAINQLDPDAPDALSNQSRLAGKIAELETRQAALQQQLELLHSQRASLLLRAPIAGSVVAKDLQRHLAERPVRRGDPLFSIVDQAGPWQIRVQVADRDVGYLRNKFPLTPPADAAITFTLASNPAERWPAQVDWISDHVENQHGQGCFVEVRAAVEAAEQVGAHAGAGVHAFFSCGQQPLWFVWSRPLVEAVQRKYWFGSPSGE